MVLVARKLKSTPMTFCRLFVRIARNIGSQMSFEVASYGEYRLRRGLARMTGMTRIGYCLNRGLRRLRGSVSRSGDRAYGRTECS